MPTLKLSREGFKAAFFDREKILREIDRGTRKALGHAGGYVRKVARNSMKPGESGEVSAPGDPPLAHGNQLLRRGIWYAASGVRGARSVVVGPVKLNTPTDAPSVLEFGGTTVREGWSRDRNAKGHSLRREKRVVRIAARPYMAPALEKSKDHIPKGFRNVVVRRA